MKSKWKVEHIQKCCVSIEIYHMMIEDKHVEHVLHVCEYYFTIYLLDMFSMSILIISLYGEFKYCLNIVACLCSIYGSLSWIMDMLFYVVYMVTLSLHIESHCKGIVTTHIHGKVMFSSCLSVSVFGL